MDVSNYFKERYHFIFITLNEGGNVEKENTVLAAFVDFSDEVQDNSREKFTCEEETLEIIDECFKADKSLLIRLSFTALGYIRNYFFRNTIGEMTSDDVVHNVLEKIITGKRRWNRDNFPHILDFIRVCMLSYVRNEKKRKLKHESVDLYNEIGELEEWKHKDYLSACLDKYFTESIVEAGKFDRVLDILYHQLRNDEAARAVLEKRLAGFKSNIAISNELDYSVKKVENALKRIRRKFLEAIRHFEEKY